MGGVEGGGGGVSGGKWEDGKPELKFGWWRGWVGEGVEWKW